MYRVCILYLIPVNSLEWADLTVFKATVDQILVLKVAVGKGRMTVA